MSGVPEWVEQQVYRGPQVWKFLEDWRQSWDGWNFEVERVLAAGGEVFAGIHERAKGADTGVGVDQHRYPYLPCATHRLCGFRCSATGMWPSKPWAWRTRRCRRHAARPLAP